MPGSFAHPYPFGAGCMDSRAANYRALATRDSRDYTCLYLGCLEEDSLNYDPSASISGVCTARTVGCTHADASNYQSAANTPGPCNFVGCMNSHSLNYNPTATVVSGQCTIPRPGCTDPQADNFEAQYNSDDGSCQIGGCTVERDSTYNAKATFFDGTCAGQLQRQLHLASKKAKSSGTGCMSPLVPPPAPSQLSAPSTLHLPPAHNPSQTHLPHFDDSAMLPVVGDDV